MKKLSWTIVALIVAISIIVAPIPGSAGVFGSNYANAATEDPALEAQSPVPLDESMEAETATPAEIPDMADGSEETDESADAADGSTAPDQPSDEAQEPQSIELPSYNADSIIQDAEAEQAYRDSVEYVDNKIVFSVLDYREKDAKPKYLTSWSELCRKYKLKKVELVIEVKTDKAEKKEGLTAYQVFYSATVKTDDIWSVVDAMAKEEGVMSAEPDFVWESAAEDDMQVVDPEELEFSNWSEHGIDCEEIWGSLTEGSAPGEGVVVAVVDTGVDYNHNDLKNSMWVNPGEIADNGIDDDGNGYIDDIHGINLIDPNKQGDPQDDMGHGTHVAGIIAMSPGNGGGVGIAYGAKIMAVKAGQANGSLASTDIARGIQYAAANGADVINMSFAGPGRSSLVEAALADAFGSCVLVASAGNNGLPTEDYPTPPKIDMYPAGYNYVLGIMASQGAGNVLADFSNWDYFIEHNCEYELAAPGVAIMSTLPNNRYAKWSGTSMAAPVVSATAAIIRREHPDKNHFPSRYIMGQLVSATNDKVYKIDGQTVYGPYPLLNIDNSLANAPHPNLSINDLVLFDSKEISSSNNGDGVIQSGETIDIGLDLFNRWGIANEVNISVDATSEGGVDNPYVEFITDEISLANEVGTFASINNGYVYDENRLVGVENPIRIKISDNAPNELSISLNITISSKNGMDATDEERYEKWYVYTFSVQKGVYLRGTIAEDMTLSNDKLWIVDRAVLIPEGVTVDVDPGTHIQFYSTETGPYAEIHRTNILVKGTMNFNGTIQEPIQIYPGRLHEDYLVDIGRAYDNAAWTGTINMDYVKIYNPYISISNGNHLYLQQTAQNYLTDIKEDGGVLQTTNDANVRTMVEADHLEKSIVTNFVGKDYRTVFYPTIGGELDTVLLNRNALFYDNSYQYPNKNSMSTSESFLDANTLNRNNVFLNNYNVTHQNGYDIVSPSRFDLYGIFENNAILNDQFFSHWFKVNVNKFNSSDYDIAHNYWGTSNQDLINKMVVDVEDNTSLQKAIYTPFLTLGDDLSSIYPFVTEAYVTDASGENRLDTVSGSQTVQLHVKFNRDMAQESDFEPMVSFGPAEPYTDYVVQGDWVSAREWVGTIKIDPFINQGIEYIRIKDAAAADDHWLKTGTDTARFSFEITKNSAEALTLQGNGGSNCNYLNWVQDDFDTLAGYNLYRSTSYDSTVPLEEQSFEKINSTIIANDVYEYTDNDVEQGIDYYYYFTVVDTDFNESKPSNVVKCTPLDEESPVIVTRAIPTQTVSRQVAVTADITDNVEVTGATLYYRMEGAENWTEVQMRNTTGDTYQGVISAYDVAEGTMQYYIAAQDGTNTTYAGTAEVPNVFAVQGIVYAQSVTLSQTTAELTVGDTTQIEASIFPENATDPSVTWTSSDETIATVDEEGNVTATGIGTAYLTATSADGRASAICSVTVDPVLVSAVSLDPTEREVQVGDTFTIAAETAPENASNTRLTWESSDTGIATVDETGKVTALGVGTVTITASTADASDIEATCTVTVKPVGVKSISVTPTTKTIYIGDETTLSATVYPANATNKNVTWNSSAPGVASVDNGVVTANGGGIAIITATSADSGQAAICIITVQPILITDIELSQDELSLNTGDTATLTVTKIPVNATSDKYIWKSDNKTIVKVSNGVVTAVAPGMTYVHCTTTDGSDITKICRVDVYGKSAKPAAPEVVSKSKTTVTLKQVEGAMYSCDGENWVESNKFIGLTEDTEYSFYIKMKQNGYYLESDASDPTVVRTDAAVYGIEVNPENADLIVGDQVQLNAVIEPTTGSQALEWTSTNPTIATVDQNGIVTALAIGHTYIMCKSAEDSEIYAIVTIKVYDISDTPDMPELVGATENSITLTSVSGLEYRVEDEAWTEDSELTGLQPDTDYNVSVRIAANGFHKESAAARAVIRTTDHDWADEISVDVEPTYYEEGSGSIHCKVCGAQKPDTTVTLPVKEKEPEWLQALADKDAALQAKADAELSLTQAQQQLATANETIETLNSTIESQEATIEQKEAALAQAQEDLDAANAALTQATEDLNAANTQLIAANATITVLQGTIAGKDEELAQAAADLQAAQAELSDTQEALETATTNYNNTKAQLDAANETITSLRAQLTEKEASLTQALADKDAALQAKADAELSLTQAQQQLTTANETIATLNSTIESQEATIEQKEAALAQAQEDLDAANAALTQATEDLNAANTQLIAANATITLLQGTVAGKDEELAQAAADLQAAQAELSDTQSALETATTNYNNTKAQLDAANETITSLRAQLTEKEAALTQALADKDAALQAKTDAELSLTQAQQQLATANETIEALNSTIESQEATIEQKEAALAQAQEDLDAANTALNQATEDLNAANDLLAVANDRIANLEQALDGNNDDLLQALEDLSAAQRELSDTQEALETATTNYNNTKAQLDAANETIASLNSQLTEKEAALTQALADKDAALQAKADAEASLTQAQQQLTTANETIASLNSTIQSKDATIEQKEAALAQAQEDLDTANAALTQATEDLNAANTQLIAANATITLLQGTIAGKDEELAQASEDLQAAQAELADTQSALETATTNYNNTKAQLDEADATITSLRAQLTEKEAALTQALADKDAALQAKADAEASLTQAQQQMTTANETIATLNSTIQSKDATIEQKEAALAQAQEDLDAANTALRQAQADLASANNQLEAANTRITNLESTLADTSDDLEEALEQLSTARDELTDAQNQLTAKQTELDTVTANYNSTRAELDAANLTIASLRTELQNKETALTQALADKDAALQAKSDALESLAQAQADLQTAQETINNLNTAIANKDSTITDLNESLTQANADLDAANSALRQAQADLASANSQLEAANTRITNLENTLAETNGDLDEALEQLSTARDELSAAQSELTAKQTELDTVTANYNSTRADLDAANLTIASLRTELNQAIADKEAAEERAKQAEEELEKAKNGQQGSVQGSGSSDSAQTESSTPTSASAGTQTPAASAEIVDLKAVKISKPKAAKKGVTVKWKKVTKKNQKKIQGIEIQVSTDPAFTNIVKSTTAGKKKTSKKIKGLQSKTKYWVRIRAYKNASDGKHVSAWKTKSFKAK